MMESTEEELSSFTTKGRRTKRQRSLLAASASSSYRGGGDGEGGCSGSSSSASASDDHDVTTEEEDMANCLILLAQGIQRKGSNLIKSNNNNNNNIGVYECKTCNKTFPSFQALGGHRTSHKKIKPPASLSPDHHDVVVDLDVMEFTSVNKNIVVQTQTHRENNNNSKARVHECSICGSEFPSGQALGGHMRRHRGPANPSTTVSSSPGLPITSTVIDTGGPRNILSLDLNLPAPDDQDDQDDHHIETKFVHVLPRPAPLVDCHY